MGKSRARVPSYYRQSIQNAVNRQINLGRTKTAASLNREAIEQAVSYLSLIHISEPTRL